MYSFSGRAGIAPSLSRRIQLVDVSAMKGWVEHHFPPTVVSEPYLALRL